MDRAEKIQHISRLPIFSALDDTEIAQFEPLFRVETYRSGEYVFRQGEYSFAMYLFLAGRGRLLRVGADQIERRGADVEPGEFVGEKSLFLHDARPNSLLVVRDATVLVLPRRNFDDFVRRYPRIKSRLNVRNDVRVDVPEQDFPWLNRGEIVLKHTRRHPWAFYRRAALAIPVLFLLLPAPLVVWLFPVLPNFLIGPALIFALVVPILYVVYTYLDWENDWFVITNQRVVHEEHILLTFNQMREQSPLDSIQSVQSEQDGYLQTRLNFGDLLISTAGAGGTLRFTMVENPDGLQSLINKELNRTTAYHAAADREKIRGEIDRFLGTKALNRTRAEDIPQPGSPVADPEPVEPILTRFQKQVQRVMDYLDIRVRIDQGYRVIYRTHWLILWQQIFTPLFFIVLTFIVMVLAVINGNEWPWNAFHPLLVSLLFIALFILEGFWLWWRYEDWHNDRYIIEDQTLTHIHRRPLWLKDVESTIPIRNIQGVDVTVQGIWQQVLNYGTVRVQTAADAHASEGGKGQIVFTYIYQPNALQNDILGRLRAETRKKEQDQQSAFSEEIAHWLAIYHQATHPDDFAAQPTQDFLDKGEVPNRGGYYHSEDD